MGLGAINPALSVAFWQTSAGGDYIRQAEQKGMTGTQAQIYGTIMGAMESITESIGAKLTENVGKAFFKDGAKEGLKAFGLDIAENFFEEAIMEPIDEAVTQLSGGEADYNNIGARMWESGINGALTSVLMGGASAGIGKASNVIFKMQNGQQVTQEEIADALKEINKSEEVDIEKLLAESFKFTAEDLYKNLDAQARTEQKLENIAGQMTQEEGRNLLPKKQDTTTQNKAILPQAEQTTQEQGKVAQNETSQEIRQDEELTEKTGQIVTNLMRSIDNYNNTRQEGEKVFDINDENTRKEIESIQKIAQDRGINITFDESRFDNSTDNAFYEYDDNGNVANIVLNPNSASKKYVQNLAVHELVHSFSGDKKSNLMNSVLDYAKTLEGYNKAYQDITNAYKSKYGNNVSEDVINEEVVANILGEKLGDKQFVNDMINGKYATQNRGFVEKIYEFVKNQINRFRGYKDQEQYWKHVKELFDDAYKNSEINKGQSYSREATAMTNIKDSQGRNLSEGQVEYFKDSKLRDDKGNLIPMYHSTNADFTVFDKSKLGDNTFYDNTAFGFFVTPNKVFSERFQDINNEGKSGKTMEVYIDAKKPITYPLNANYKYSGAELDRITREWLEGTGASEYISELENQVEEGEADNIWEAYVNMLVGETSYDLAESEREMLEKNGYDAVEIVEGIESDLVEGSKSNEPVSSYAVFNSNQIKNVDNITPTDNQDIRYSTEYQGEHQIDTENSTTLDNLDLTEIENKVKKVNGALSKQDYSDLARLKKALQNPDNITIYRASPVNELNNGDWVTTDKAYAQNVAKENGGKVYTYQVSANELYYPDNVKDLPSLHRLSSFQYNSQEQISTTDNQGNKLSKGQQKYFENVSPEELVNGKIPLVFHTTTDRTAQFNEFNPVGTRGYRFGDQVVNYYTDSKDMSGSYANSNYKMADTKKLTSLEDVQKYIKDYNNTVTDETSRNYGIIKNNDGTFSLIDNSEAKKETADFLNNLTDEEKQELFDNIYYDEDLAGTPYENSIQWDKLNKTLQKKYRDFTDKYIGTGKIAEVTSNLVSMLNYDDTNLVLGTYQNENELFRNLKQDMQVASADNNKIQYSGYVKLTNPYVIDAEGRNWDTISYDIPTEIREEINNIKSNRDTLFQLKDLAEESVEKNKEYETSDSYTNYKMAEEVKDGIISTVKGRTGTAKDFREALQDCIWFGFEYSDYIEKLRELGTEMPSGDTKVEDLISQSTSNEYDIKQKLSHYGNMTLDEFVKEIYKLTGENLKYGKPSSYFKENYSKITGKPYFDNNGLNGDVLFK